MDTSQQLKKAVEIIPKTTLILQEVLSVIKGIKPTSTHNLSEKEQKLISYYLPELKIECLPPKSIKHPTNKVLCAISRKNDLAKEVLSYILKNNFKKAGQLLSYPECCIDSLLQFLPQKKYHEHQRKLIYRLHKNSKSTKSLTNNLFNFSSRLVTTQEVQEFRRYYSINENFSIPLHYLQFISHIPCSYDCRESIKIGKKIRGLLKEYAPAIEKVVTDTLSKPVLFFDLFKWIIFNGDVKNDTSCGEPLYSTQDKRSRTIFYNKVISPISLIDSSLLNKIRRGNKILADDNKIKIFKNNLLLYSYSKKDKIDGFILDFK